MNGGGAEGEDDDDPSTCRFRVLESADLHHIGLQFLQFCVLKLVTYNVLCVTNTVLYRSGYYTTILYYLSCSNFATTILLVLFLLLE